MTEFETAVRAAMGLLRDDRGNEVLDQLAPRVAAAIEAAQNALAEKVPWAVLHVHGYEWTPAEQEKNVADIHGAALEALRGARPADRAPEETP